MENIKLETDIKVFYITASSFPAGIAAATTKLHSLFPFSKKRRIFGVSRPENGGGIIYRAAAEEMKEGEAQQLNCETLIIRKGDYVSLTVDGFRKNPMAIKKAFDLLLTEHNLDPNGYCVEWYDNERESVRCMIRLNK